MSLGDPIGTTYGHLYMAKSDFGDDYVIVASKHCLLNYITYDARTSPEIVASKHCLLNYIIYDARTRPEDVLIAKGYKSAQSLYDKVEKDRAIQMMKEL